MLHINEVCAIVRSFPEVEEAPHFDKLSFRVRKKIFATFDAQKAELVLKFTLIEQTIFTTYDTVNFYPVPGGWGKKGWTIMQVNNIDRNTCKEALKTAYCLVAPKVLSQKIEN